MTHFRQLMTEELERRNYAPTTMQVYLRAVERVRSILQQCSRPARAGSHLAIPSLFVS